MAIKINTNFAQEAQEIAYKMIAENATKVLAAELEAARTAELTLQNNADAAASSKDTAATSSGILWNKYRNIVEHGLSKGLKPAEIDAAMTDSLVKLDPKEKKKASTNTINMYRSVSRRYMVVLADLEGFGKSASKAGVSLKNSDGSTKPVGFTDAKKILKEYTRTEDERRFAALVKSLNESLQTAIKSSKADKKAGTPELEGVPLSEMIALVSEFLQMIPQRTVKVEAEKAQAEPTAADDANAAAADATEDDAGNVQVAHAA